MRGIQVAKPGKRIDGAQKRELIFDSTLNTFKFQTSGFQKVTGGTNATDQSNIVISHNLGYVPTFLIYAYNIDGYGAENGSITIPTFDNSNLGPTLIPTIDTQALTVHLYNDGRAGSDPGQFYLYYLIGAEAVETLE